MQCSGDTDDNISRRIYMKNECSISKENDKEYLSSLGIKCSEELGALKIIRINLKKLMHL